MQQAFVKAILPVQPSHLGDVRLQVCRKMDNDTNGDERLAKAVRLDQIQFGGIGGLTTAGHSISLTVSVIDPTNNSVIETGPTQDCH